MNLLGPINPLSASPLMRAEAPLPKISLPSSPQTAAPSEGFGQVLDGIVGTVDAKQKASAALTRQVLLGDSDQLHQGVIAMQEAGVAFSLMVEMRNKLVESYQELMRMQV